MNKKFIYYDVDYLSSLEGWLEARLDNRFREGFEIWRDEKEMAWRGIKKQEIYIPIGHFTKWFRKR